MTVATQAHQGPDEGSDVVFDLGSGTIVNASIRAGEWIQVVDDQGNTGWVPAKNTLDVQ